MNSTESQKPKPKFVFREIVRIINSKHEETFVLNLEGRISGMAVDDEGFWTYGVFIFDINEVWGFDEEDLESTGRLSPKPENIETSRFD